MAAANGLISPSNLRNGDLDDLVNDFGFLLREGSHQRRTSSSFFADANAVDINRYNSGSTGSDENTASNPAFLPYHYMNPRFSGPGMSMEEWISTYGKIGERGDQVFGCGINDGNNCSLFTLQSNFQSSSDPFVEFKRNSIGLKNRSFADVLQANLPQSHFQSSSTAINRSKTEATSTALKSFTASGLPVIGQNAYNPAVDDRDFCEGSSVQRSPSSMNSYIYGGEGVSRNLPYSAKKVYSNGGHYGSFTYSPRVKYPVSSSRPGNAGSSLGEFNNFRKSTSLEIADIVSHAVEFSVDQHGSRFLQQKLETASCEDKNLIFPEILSHSLPLMADVFGNYVIQKFLEHGSDAQRRQLASQLCGHVLSLSLQVYGCRVIQKALEVIDMDQRVELVSELDGAIMICVCDQNGNHVIQKCIECIPQERIRFIVNALRGHVLNLSLHPYGCRVIQRVLEICADASTQRYMMDEILTSLSSLAQDQYGNYVVQHVLHHGSKKQRSAIIRHLAGKIGALSQQKYSSNVVEKCLTFCSPDERALMVNEMLESVDGSDPPLLVMMKDQFGNYVVQKALETCDDKSREMILSCVRAHMGYLKRSTFAKHVSARVDKVIAAGERHMRASSY